MCLNHDLKPIMIRLKTKELLNGFYHIPSRHVRSPVTAIIMPGSFHLVRYGKFTRLCDLPVIVWHSLPPNQKCCLLSKMPANVWNCLWGHLKDHLGSIVRVGYRIPVPDFYLVLQPSLPKKQYNGLNQTKPNHLPVRWSSTVFFCASFR